MKLVTAQIVVVMISVLVLPTALAQQKETIEKIDLSKIETRQETLKNGRTILVPKNATMVPGHPIMFTQKQLDGFEKSKESLDTMGYIQAPSNSRPMAEEVLQAAQNSYSPSSYDSKDSRKRLADGQFVKTNEIDIKTLGLNPIDAEYLTRDSEGFVSAGRTEAVRVYANTKLGDVYIHEILGAKLRTLGEDPSYAVQFGDAKGYRSNIRYSDGRMVTLYALATKSRVLTIALDSNNPDEYYFISRLTSEQSF